MSQIKNTDTYAPNGCKLFYCALETTSQEYYINVMLISSYDHLKCKF